MTRKRFFVRTINFKGTLIIVRLMQMAAAVKMILYAADAKGSALTEAQEYIYQSQNRTDVEDENEEE